ncbi:MAG: dienelactone hydrolase [Hyphomicrobiales bacterium]|jgi:pimeloyl-ACP methyl ester carboxylesterase|nr:dienelactone hydrolase [Hyphomicrobiales bacterium]
MQERITIDYRGLKLTGLLDAPTGACAEKPCAAIMVLHGFGGNKDGASTRLGAAMLADFGYATLRLDMPGCGESEGERGRVICLEQVECVKLALDYLESRPQIDSARLGLMGSSFGGAVSVYAAGTDQRVGAVISAGGWGDGEKKFRGQHPSPEAWAKFTGILEEGRRRKAETGESLMVSRFDIVPIPEHLRQGMSAGGHMAFPAETAQSMFDFRANDVVGRIAPRPLLLLHSAMDSVTPTDQSIELFRRAGQPTDLILLSDVDHFAFGENNPRVRAIVQDWLAKYFPA